MSEQPERPDVAFISHSHESLHEMMTSFLAALAAGKSARHINNLRDDFKACLHSHIEFENYIMIFHSYPLTYAHVEAHGSFKDLIEQILEDAVRNGDGSGAVAAIKEAHDRHVAYHDDLLCRFLTDRYALEAVIDGLGI